MVTIVQGGEQLLAREDPDVAGEIAGAFMDAGITLRLGARAQRSPGPRTGPRR